MRRLALALLAAAALPAHASLDNDGVWAAGVWDPGVFAEGVWDEETNEVTVPDVTSLDLTDADTELEEALLDTGTVTAHCSAEDEDEVTAQEPVAGTIVAEGTLVDLLASNGMACAPGPENSGRNVHSISIDIGIRL